jgi:hypothetical protein
VEEEDVRKRAQRSEHRGCRKREEGGKRKRNGKKPEKRRLFKGDKAAAGGRSMTKVPAG